MDTKTMSKTDWNMTHTDMKKFENGQHFIQCSDYKMVNGRFNTYWVPVKIKGVKNGEKY